MNTSTVLFGVAGIIAPLVTIGCVSAEESERVDVVTMRPGDAKARSIELQREIVELIPQEYREKNFLPDVGEKARRLYFCKPILSEDYYSYSVPGDEAVQYPGRVFVALDPGSPVNEIVLEINAELSSRDGWTGAEASTIDPENPPYVYSPDGFMIAVRAERVPDTDIDSVQIVVWSPCFIPEGGTLPPGREI